MLQRQLSGVPPDPPLPAGAVDCQMHAYAPGFPAIPGAIPLPLGDLPTPAQYRQVMDWLGLSRVVVTQGNAHGRDNANLLACLEDFGDIARGVAVIDAQTSDAEMAHLAARGVVGARIMDLPGGAVGLEALEAVDARAHAAGWMLAVQFDGSRLLDHLPRLARLRSRWVLDHHGKFFHGVAADGPEIDSLLRLMEGGRCWVKFAGCYESSRQSWPYEDIAAPARRLAAQMPERIIWGSNWPHNLMRDTADYPDDARLAELTLGWLAEGTRQRVLVQNPIDLYGLPPP
ncbi:MAG: amidohydrolase family protein [Gemmobacter sp.]|uniref:amidohydrolase family protein n=1 Tax=Gemmobacter sp. TaxID=1898957 RepID=UPI001A63583B|nr:amidohydrolase family protein [Gemmobacter sp.]MBL8562852.1 amidohydrolase family protein [Gemmobacter sp.]